MPRKEQTQRYPGQQARWHDVRNDKRVQSEFKPKQLQDLSLPELNSYARRFGIVGAGLMNREALGSTGIGQGIAIPHAKSNFVKGIVCAFGSSKKGIAFDSLDGEPVYIVFLLIASQDSSGAHLKVLAKMTSHFARTLNRSS